VKPDDTTINIRRHFERLGGAAPGYEIYSEDAVVNFGHIGERLVGRADIKAARHAYPVPPCQLEVHRVIREAFNS
jgi:hypothetical protein